MVRVVEKLAATRPQAVIKRCRRGQQGITRVQSPIFEMRRDNANAINAVVIGKTCIKVDLHERILLSLPILKIVGLENMTGVHPRSHSM
jgi:hypothetical protein